MNRYFFLITLIILCQSALCQTKETVTIHFDFDKSGLTAGALQKLDSFVNKIGSLSINSVRLSGYCDSKGSNNYNNALSSARVKKVKNYLQEKIQHAEPIAFTAKGFGENNLLNSDHTDEESRENRRVEIIVTLNEPTEMLDEQPLISKDTTTSIPVKETRSLTTILQDSAVKKGSTITLQNLEFHNASDVMLTKSIPTLEELYNFLVKNPKMTIAIEGHICCVVNAEGISPEQSPSFYVSVIRAKKVSSWLIQKGIDPGRLSYTGFGNSNPISPIPEKSEEERIANRRVEIRITEK